MHNQCLICSYPDYPLCSEHKKLYVLDNKNNWVRKKKRLHGNERRNIKYHKTETKLYEILKLIFGSENVISSVHPLWALSDKGVLLEYDIGVVNRNLLVEYDGIQHYIYPNFFHKRRRDFEAQVARDKIKTNLAEKNGWKLLRIKYNEKVDYATIHRKIKATIEGV